MSTKYTVIVVVLLGFILLNGLSLLNLTNQSRASGREIYVDDDFYYPRDGTAEHPYQKISEAINLANEGDTIYVFGGTYNETLVINKKISLVGGIDEGPTVVSRNADHRYTVEITADYVTLENFTILDKSHIITSQYGALIHVTANNVVLQKNNISYCNLWGVYLDSSDDNTISGNLINATKGVLVSSSNNNVFSNNNISNSSDAAIDLRSSTKNIIYQNRLKTSTFGIYERDCSYTNITKNNITKNVYHGMYTTGERNDVIDRNIFKNNSVSGITLNANDCILNDNLFNRGQNGLMVQQSGCQIINNTFTNLSSIGLSMLQGSKNNMMSFNHFLRNEVNAKELGKNQWDNGAKGNYWDDYNYVDRNHDGIGDHPYTISAGIQDHYPLGIFLKPPQKPFNPSPKDDAENVKLKITLKVKIVDPDSRLIDRVTFYNAGDNVSVGSAQNVQNGMNASCMFTLGFDTVFAWYAIANDSLQQNQSDIWFFTTNQRPPTNKKPVASPGGPYIGKLNQTITFDGSRSVDPDGTIIFYRWNFGDGSSQILDKTPKHSYSDPGIYTVTLTVVDNDGRSSMANTTATISGEVYINSPPLAIFAAPLTATVNQLVTFDASESNDTDGTVVGYRWDFNNDGTFDTDWLATPVITHTFSTVGNMTVKLEVKDDANASGFFTELISIHAPAKKTPGFEILLVILAILVCLPIYIKERR